ADASGRFWSGHPLTRLAVQLVAGTRRAASGQARPSYIAAMTEERETSLKTAIRRALLGRCPACGQGKLFHGYLKQVENCSACSERFGHIRADDAAPWGTIILVGHVFLPLAFLVNVDFMPTWAAMLLWASLFS